MSSRKKEVLSAAMERTSEWIFSQEIPSDLTVRVGSASFSLHKFPLVSKCEYFRKLVSESTDADPLDIEISDVPGGAEAFELAIKFCYGINFEISIENIALLRCVAEYLEMTEDCAVGNLIGRSEAYLSEMVYQSLSNTVSVLHASESLLPVAENCKLVSCCVDAIAYLACNDTKSCQLGTFMTQQNLIVDWWAEDLTLLKIDFFQRVLIAMMARGFKQYALGPVLMLYAQKYLRGLDVFGKVKKKMEPTEQHKKRVIIETIVSLLPKEKNALSVSFLSTLLRSSIYLETTVACKLDLEKRMALQLGQAVIDDLLIPSYSFTGDTLFDVDTVKRIMMNYLEYVMDANHMFFGTEDYISPSMSDLERVGKLMENYLAEIASDRNLTVPKFVAIAELIPEQSRATEDGMYRAIDIFLKAHPDASEMERKKLCSLMDCQKLSREACAHAAQNDRLPVQTVVQVLYHEQQNLQNTMNSKGIGDSTPVIHVTNTQKEFLLYSTIDHSHLVSNELASLRRENEDLKIELVKVKMKLKEMERLTSNPVTVSSNSNISSSYANKPPLPRKSFINSVSKKLGKLYPIIKGDAITTPNTKNRNKPSRDRRHSVS